MGNNMAKLCAPSVFDVRVHFVEVASQTAKIYDVRMSDRSGRGNQGHTDFEVLEIHAAHWAFGDCKIVHGFLPLFSAQDHGAVGRQDTALVMDQGHVVVGDLAFAFLAAKLADCFDDAEQAASSSSMRV